MGAGSVMSRLAVPIAALAVALWSVTAAGQVPGTMLGVLMSGGADASGVLPDAFRSSVSRDGGLWSVCPAVGGPAVELERRHLEPLTRRLTAGEGAAFDRTTTARYLHPLAYRAWDVQLGASLSRADASSWADGVDGATRLDHEGSVLGVSLRAHNRRLGLEILAVGPLARTASGLPGERTGGAVRFAPDRRLVLQASHGLEASRAGLGGRVIDDPVAFDLNAGQRTWRAGIAAGPWRRLACDLAWTDTTIDPLDEITDAHRYELSPTSAHTGWRGAATMDLGAGHDVVLGLAEKETEVEAGACWGGQKFGWLNYLESRLRTRILGWRWASRGSWRIQTEWEWSRLEARARAKVESWPFTSTVVDLMGIKQIAYGELELDWDRVSCLYARESAGTSLSLGGAYYRISPRARLETWQPAFLVFGRTDYRLREWDVTRIDLGALLLKAEVGLGTGGALLLSLQQFLWADVKRIRGVADGGADGAQDHEESVPDGWYGGTYLTAGLRWRL